MEDPKLSKGPLLVQGPRAPQGLHVKELQDFQEMVRKCLESHLSILAKNTMFGGSRIAWNKMRRTLLEDWS